MRAHLTVRRRAAAADAPHGRGGASTGPPAGGPAERRGDGAALDVEVRHRLAGFELDARFVAPSGVTVLFGPSGSGKTSLVNAVAGLLRPEGGRIAVGGEVLFDAARGLHLPPHRRRMGYVFQEGRLLPHLSVRQNLLYGRRFAVRAPGDPDGPGDGPELGDVVDLLGISALLGRRPLALSGGEKARVAIGRALLARPRLLLLDEPLASLDAARKAEVMPYLERLGAQARVPVLYVSHAIEEVVRLATTLVLMDGGRVLRAGPAGAVMADPGLSGAFGGHGLGAVIGARVLGEAGLGLTRLAAMGGELLLAGVAAPPGARLRVRIPADGVILAPGGAAGPPGPLSALNVLPAVVREVREEGAEAVVQLLCGEDLILARVTRLSAAALGLAPGLACHAILKSVAIAPADMGAGMDAEVGPPGTRAP